MSIHKTLVGNIDEDILAFTVGKDPELDLALAEADCIGSAAHVTMLADLDPPLFSASERDRVIDELVSLILRARRGRLKITAKDQDVHLAVERLLTARLGEAGRRIHTGRSRNDQVALDLRLYGKEQVLGLMDETLDAAEGLVRMASRRRRTPMVGRTHMQPAMPSTVGLWAAAYAEGLLDDLIPVGAAFELNDRCPLGAAAGYGTTLPVDRALTARLLGFAEPVHTVLHAIHSRGKVESAILSAAGQVMLTLSRLAEDLILFSAPEFAYFRLPDAVCTGSSIMPQKKNPDVLELIRAKASRVVGDAATAAHIVCGLPAGYNRDLQETKPLFIDGLATTRASLRMCAYVVERLEVDAKALERAFTPGVFATDRALDLVAEGRPFRDAYQDVKAALDTLSVRDPKAAAERKTHLGAPGGLDLDVLRTRLRDGRRRVRRERKRFHAALSKVLNRPYPELEDVD